MLELLLAASLVQADPELESNTFYAQAVACAASTSLALGPEDQAGTDLMIENLTWQAISSRTASEIDRTEDWVRALDLERAVQFFTQVKTLRPDVYQAHLAYCRAVMTDPADPTATDAR